MLETSEVMKLQHNNYNDDESAFRAEFRAISAVGFLDGFRACERRIPEIIKDPAFLATHKLLNYGPVEANNRGYEHHIKELNEEILKLKKQLSLIGGTWEM